MVLICISPMPPPSQQCCAAAHGHFPEPTGLRRLARPRPPTTLLNLNFQSLQLAPQSRVSASEVVRANPDQPAQYLLKLTTPRREAVHLLRLSFAWLNTERHLNTDTLLLMSASHFSSRVLQATRLRMAFQLEAMTVCQTFYSCLIPPTPSPLSFLVEQGG